MSIYLISSKCIEIFYVFIISSLDNNIDPICTVKAKHFITPKYLIVTVGNTAQFSCEEDENVTWTFKGRALPHNTITHRLYGTNHNYLTIMNVEVENEGVYTCITSKDNINYGSDADLVVDGR